MRFARIAQGTGLALVFSAATLGGVLLHVRIGVGRRLVASTLTAVLDRTFMGRLVVTKIGTIDSEGFDGAEASVYDPSGRLVLSVTGLRGRASVAKVVLAVAKGGEIVIVVPRARVEHADAMIIPDADGVPTLARAFTPRPSTGGGGGPAPKVSVWLPEVEMRTACVKGRIEGLGDIDVDIANVTGSVLAGTDRTSVQVRRYSMNGVAPVTARGTADTRIEIPSPSGRSISVWSAFDGYVGDVQVDARGELDGKEIAVTGDIVRARPEAVRALWADWPVQHDIDLHFESKGTPPVLATRGRAQVEQGSADFTGEIRTGGGVSFDMAVDARRIDLRSFDLAAPEAAVSANGRVSVTLVSGRAATGSFEAKTEPTRILGIDVPTAAVKGTIDGPLVSGKGEIRDKAMSSDVDFDVHPVEPGGPVAVDLVWSARVPEISKVPWLAPVGSGSASWRARGRVVRAKLDAKVDGIIQGFTRTGVELAQAHIVGSVQGRLAEPELSLSLDGKALVVGPLYFPEVRATADGPLVRLRVKTTGSGADAPELTASATIETTEAGTGLRDVELLAKRGEVTLSGKVRSIQIAGDRVDLRDIAVTGAGATVSASLVVSPDELHVKASADELDLKKLGSVVLPNTPIEGRLSFDVDADLKANAERGHVRLRLEDASVAGLRHVTAQAEADAAGRQFSGGAELRVGELGSISARTVGATLAGPFLRASSWTNATGKLEMDAQVDLEHVGRMPLAVFASSVKPEGQVFAKLLLAREALEAHQKHDATAKESPPPDVDFLVWTDHLRLAERARPHFAKADAAAAPLAEGLDVQVGLHLQGEGEQAQVTARVIDDEGIFAGLTAVARVPVTDLWHHPKELRERLLALPFTAKVTVPARSLENYPAIFRPQDLLGEVEGTGSMTGSVRAPQIAFAVRGKGIRPATTGVAFPVDVDAQAAYDGKKFAARVRAMRPEGVVLDARADVDVPLQPVLDTGSGLHWEASGSAQLANFPLSSLSSVVGSEMAGLASGTMRFSGVNRDPDVQADIDVKDVKVDRAEFRRALGVLRIAKGGLVASASAESATGTGSATATARLKWNSPVLPDVDAKEPLDVYFAAKDFRAAALYPLLFRGIFTYFDGRLNGTLHFHQDASSGEVAQTVDGSFNLRDGIFQIPEMGQEFRNAAAKITVTRKGEVDVSNVSANGVSGRLTASGKMMVKGLSFVSAEGEVRIAEREKVPLTLEGVSLGDAWGTLMLHAKRPDERTIKLDVDVPVFHTELPESSARDVQALADHPDIKVGVRTNEGTLSAVLLGVPLVHRSEDALVWKITFFLGEDVKVRRGRNFELSLGGEPEVELTDEARVTGQVQLKGGKVEVFGKSFDIEHGLAKFDGDDTSNPTVNVTARWDAPDGTHIFVDFAGRLRTGVLTLRSEPPQTHDKILAILLFGGTPDSAQQSSLAKANSNDTGEWVVGGAAVTTNVNRVLSSVTPLDITTRVTNDAQSPTPEVAIQISPKLSAEISYRTRPPTPFENQDRTLVTLDWRFRRNWSIATTVGQQSSVVDLIWRYRY